MICNICGTSEATIHLTEIVNNQMVEVHLCEPCAHEKGTEFKAHFNVGDLLSGLKELASEVAGGERAFGKCSSCGLTYEDFGRTGRLGCADCYKAFAQFLIPLIKRVQHSTQHVGRRPSRLAPVVRAGQELRELQSRLEKSIQKEAFEEAAKIRDQMRQLEEKIKRGKKKTNE